MENPGWYTQYTPYQAEISQGRLEALLNFQTMVADLTGLDIANASLLDEATAAEAMTMVMRKRAQKRNAQANIFFVSEKCHPQTIAVVKQARRATGLQRGGGRSPQLHSRPETFGLLLQYPATNGDVHDLRGVLRPSPRRGRAGGRRHRPAGADPAHAARRIWRGCGVGNSQRFGVPMGYGGPHAAFMATKDDLQADHARPVDRRLHRCQGKPAMRLALQTREQHIRRDKATSNICTAQVLLAIMASMYAVYHGPAGLRRIARRVQLLTTILAAGAAPTRLYPERRPLLRHP
jgi:glycine dehydrogenase